MQNVLSAPTVAPTLDRNTEMRAGTTGPGTVSSRPEAMARGAIARVRTDLPPDTRMTAVATIGPLAPLVRTPGEAAWTCPATTRSRPQASQPFNVPLKTTAACACPS